MCSQVEDGTRELTIAQIYAEVLTVIFSHPNVRRTVGQSGMLQRFVACFIVIGSC